MWGTILPDFSEILKHSRFSNKKQGSASLQSVEKLTQKKWKKCLLRLSDFPSLEELHEVKKIRWCECAGVDESSEHGVGLTGVG